MTKNTNEQSKANLEVATGALGKCSKQTQFPSTPLGDNKNMDVQFISANEGALFVETGPDSIQRIHRLVALLDHSPLDGLEEITPSYTSILLEYDPNKRTQSEIEAHVRFCLDSIGNIELAPPQQMEIPVFYGGEFGPDLAPAAERLGMSVSQLVEAHCNLTYSVAFFGFLPGFAYLSGWPAKLSLPRLDSPRARVPAGSVAIAGAQCGIYPIDSPGGWRILGRTPLKMIDTSRTNFSLLSIGAQLRFYPSNPAAW